MISEFRGAHYFLSNFASSPIVRDGITYPTVEHYFQAMKSLDDDERLRIASADSPTLAKRLGRRVSLRPDWESAKLGVMRDALALKFPDAACLLGWHLRSTAPHWLSEGNTWGDTFWGESGGRGQNWLGHLLMARRAELLGF